ncbi:MAG: hypothetical protein H0U09_09195 [Geodermatophilaceae bacterium]|nr:hypothetical protein [Geodermatophilaceae bacterium]
MCATTERDFLPRPRSPWTGSRYETRHRWQLDLVSSLAEAAKELRALAAELTAAHTAGWWLMEPMRSGHLLAARASRRRRAGQALGSSPRIDSTTAPVKSWRLRVVDEPPGPGQDVLDTRATDRTPVLAWTGRRLDQVAGPTLPPAVLGEVDRQVRPTGLAHRLWGLAPARVGPTFDLVADGSALRLHAVQDGALVRTQETLMFQHAADGAVALLQAAAAYRRLAAVADAMAIAGGVLISADDGLLQVGYDRSVP